MIWPYIDPKYYSASTYINILNTDNEKKNDFNDIKQNIISF